VSVLCNSVVLSLLHVFIETRALESRNTPQALGGALERCSTQLLRSLALRSLREYRGFTAQGSRSCFLLFCALQDFKR